MVPTTVLLLMIVITYVFLSIVRTGSTDTAADHTPAVTQTASISGVHAAVLFRSDELLQEHFEKHGKEMGYQSAEEYLAGANAVIQNTSALHKTEKEDGDDVYFLKSTGDFVVVSTDGYIRTYFRPEDGIAYYNRQ
jgi:hypothetical protein